MNTDITDRDALHERLKSFIQHQRGEFNALALALFAYQFELNLPYRRYCEAHKLSPQAINHWHDIPTVPTDVFRVAPLFTGKPHEARHIFRTSGTTSGRRGEHRLRDLDLYHTSARLGLARYLAPDGLQRPALMLAPSPQQLPDSSLSSMLGLIAQHHADGQAVFAWGDQGLDLDTAIPWLQRAATPDAPPVQVLATSFAMVHLLDTMAERGASMTLPARSMVMLTGGTKGRTREVSQADLEAEVTARLGVAPTHIVHEYGMTELGSQLYDPRLALAVAGADAPDTPRYEAPAWCRVTAHDPADLKRLPQGEAGLLRFTDLSNLDSVCSIQTSDVGVVLNDDPRGDTIVLHGRAPGATPRGCSLIIEETAW